MKPLIFCIIISFSLTHTCTAQMYDPFARTTKSKSTFSSSGLLPPPPLMSAPLPPPLSVSAITESKAFISGKWYRAGETIGSKKVAYIHPNYVGLQEGSRLTILTLGSKRPLFDIKEKQ